MSYGPKPKVLAPIAAALIAAAPGPVKLGSPGFKGVGVPQDKVDFFAEHFAQALTRDGLKVITPAEIKQLISLERQKALLGCADDGSNCLIELSNALGVDGIISGNIGKFGSRYQVNLKITSASQGQPLSVYGAQVADEGLVLDELTKAAAQMAPEVLAALRPGPPRRRVAWIPATAGGAVAIGGIALLGVAKGWEAQLTAPKTSLPPASAVSYRDTGPAVQGVGIGLLAAGVAGLGVAGWMFFSPGGTTVAVAPRGPGVMVGGSFR